MNLKKMSLALWITYQTQYQDLLRHKLVPFLSAHDICHMTNLCSKSRHAYYFSEVCQAWIWNRLCKRDFESKRQIFCIKDVENFQKQNENAKYTLNLPFPRAHRPSKKMVMLYMYILSLTKDTRECKQTLSIYMEGSGDYSRWAMTYHEAMLQMSRNHHTTLVPFKERDVFPVSGIYFSLFRGFHCRLWHSSMPLVKKVPMDNNWNDANKTHWIWENLKRSYKQLEKEDGSHPNSIVSVQTPILYVFSEHATAAKVDYVSQYLKSEKQQSCTTLYHLKKIQHFWFWNVQVWCLFHVWECLCMIWTTLWIWIKISTIDNVEKTNHMWSDPTCANRHKHPPWWLEMAECTCANQQTGPSWWLVFCPWLALQYLIWLYRLILYISQTRREREWIRIKHQDHIPVFIPLALKLLDLIEWTVFILTLDGKNLEQASWYANSYFLMFLIRIPFSLACENKITWVCKCALKWLQCGIWIAFYYRKMCFEDNYSFVHFPCTPPTFFKSTIEPFIIIVLMGVLTFFSILEHWKMNIYSNDFGLWPYNTYPWQDRKTIVIHNDMGDGLFIFLASVGFSIQNTAMFVLSINGPDIFPWGMGVTLFVCLFFHMLTKVLRWRYHWLVAEFFLAKTIPMTNIPHLFSNLALTDNERHILIHLFQDKIKIDFDR